VDDFFAVEVLEVTKKQKTYLFHVLYIKHLKLKLKIKSLKFPVNQGGGFGSTVLKEYKKLFFSWNV
jgi:hypothetical protein